MTGATLKVIALIAMTIDHIGYFLVSSPDEQVIFRVIGRIAMPLFCFFIAEGYRHTSSKTRYFLRLFGFAMVLEGFLYIFYLSSGENYLFSINIFLTLSAGLGCLILLDSKDVRLIPFGIILAVAVMFTDFDYGLYGILLILLFGMLNSFWLYVIGFTMINILFIHVLPVFLPEQTRFAMIQWFAMLSLLGILAYNKMPGKQHKAFFYLYYPLHISIIVGIKAIFS